MSITMMRNPKWSKLTLGLKKLASEAPGGVMVEIGCYAGESTSIFAETGKWEPLHCVDPWAEYDELKYKALRVAEKKFDEVVKRFPCITKHKMPSLEGAKLFEDGSLDLVYIDGSHQYDDVLDDIQAWLPKVRVGGWITGHDYYNERKAKQVPKEVKKAVLAYFGKPPEKQYVDTSWGYVVT